MWHSVQSMPACEELARDFCAGCMALQEVQYEALSRAATG